MIVKISNEAFTISHSEEESDTSMKIQEGTFFSNDIFCAVLQQ
jgi:hypothetical protein